MKAVIPAAGAGTRFLPITKSQPKEMLPLLDKPAIQYVVEEAAAAGFDDILIITGRGKRAIEDHFDRSIELENLLEATGNVDALREVRAVAEVADIHFIRQKEPLGLGHAILCAAKHVGDEPFAVLLGDDIVVSERPSVAQLWDLQRRHGGSVIAVEDVPREKTPLYGIVSPGREVGAGVYEVQDIVEKPAPEDAPSTLGVMGRYVLSPAIFDALRRTKPGKKNELQLTDAIKLLLAEEKVHAARVEGRRYDTGNRMDWLKTNVDFALKHKDHGAEFRAWLDAALRGGA